MENLNIVFAPELPVLVVIGLCFSIAILCLWGLWSGLRGSLVRALAGALVCLALFNPSILKEDRSPLKTVVPIVIDETTSQKLNNRDAQTEAALEQVQARFSEMENFEVREIHVSDQISQTSDVSSALFSALDNALQDVPREQVGGALFITDGQVHDVPQNSDSNSLNGPLHVLLTGKDNERDRRIVLKSAPRFGVVGESQEITYTIEQTGFGNTSSSVEVTILMDGEVVSVETVLAGEENSFIFDVPHGGKNIIEFRAEIADNEITDINNRTFTTLNGIRENLRVLLISGSPHAGERTWRNLLKSDASVDLVHFTILRPPEKQDGTPIDQLSLIAFPTRELFIEKIDEFDLIIFDRYRRRGVLPALYFDNIARYVEDGGAILIAAGPEYADNFSVASTPLSSILPGMPNGQTAEGPFLPRISETGEKHPVTRNLEGWNTEEPDWSRWFRSVGVNEISGQTVIQNEDKEPILMLDRKNEGRIALFLSDHVWLWARGFEGGGPHVQLLRRLAHWLMKEPELEEERLTANSNGEKVIITRQTIGEEPEDASIISPSGETKALTFIEQSTGVWQAEMDSSEIGLYRVSNGDLTALAQVGPANPRELAAVISTDKVLKAVTEATSGSITYIEKSGLPRIVSVSATGTRAGRGWVGFPRTEASVLNGIDRIPMFTGLLGLALLLTAFAGTWFREGR